MSELLKKLIKILMAHSGADRCVIIEKKGKELNIIASGAADSEIEINETFPVGATLDKVIAPNSKQAQDLPLLPKSVINYVLKTSETLISGDSNSEVIFKGDPYLKDSQIGSILCIPVIGKFETSYILYLENSRLAGIFNTDRLEIIKILAAQSSISLEASRLFNEMSTININMVKEIESRKETEKYLYEYKKIVSTSAEHLSIVDRNYIYKVVNDAYLVAHGRDVDNIVGHRISEFMGEDAFIGIIKDRIDRTLSGEAINYQSWFDFKGIGRKYMDVYYYPLYEQDSSIDSIVVNARDITMIKNYEDELRNYSARILSAHDEERKRIAMELHDGLAQSLLLLKMKAQGNAYSEIISDISSILNDLRNITTNLRPVFLEKVNLTNVLKWYSKQFEERSKIRLEIDVPEEFDLHPTVKEHMFRIYQEALNNVLKHSGADNVRIGLYRNNGAVILTIKDNGRGFKKPTKLRDLGKDAKLPNKISNSGLGLFTMRERVEFLNGIFEIDSSNLGTSITVSVPIEDKFL